MGNIARSITQIKKTNVEKGDICIASVYCFVSGDFNGDFTRLTIRGSATGDLIAWYDYKKKDTWQKLELNTICNQGELNIVLDFYKHGVIDFSTLEGSVIFAYPQYKIIKNGNNIDIRNKVNQTYDYKDEKIIKKDKK